MYYLSTESPSMAGPRGTKTGMTEAQITEKFRDLGQKPNQDGSRSLYHDSTQNCFGEISLVSKDGRQKRISYSYFDKEYEATISLYYYLEDGVCTRIVNSFVIK